MDSINCGSKHTLLLSRDGDVYSWGYNQYGQTGHGQSALTDWEPSIIKGLSGLKIVQVAAGEDHCLAVTETGEVFSWGRGLNGQLGQGDMKDVGFPLLIKSLQGKGVMAVGCGHNVSFALTGAGKVYGFGSSGAGQLGNGDTDGGVGGHVYLPLLIKSLGQYRIVQATGGRNFSMFLTDNGELLSVGYASNGQLGISFERVEQLDASFTGSIQRVEHTSIVFRFVSCGDAHTLALSETGHVYTWGSGIDYALGHDAQDDVFTPKLVAMLEVETCTSVGAGGCHSAAVSMSGRLYTWGRGFIGQLGAGNDVNDPEGEYCHPLPVQIQVTSNADGAEFAVNVSCGSCHTVVQTTLAGDEPDAIPAPMLKEREESALEPDSPMAKADEDAGKTDEEKERERAEREKEKAAIARMESVKQEVMPVDAKVDRKQYLTLIVEVVSGRSLLAKDQRGTSDPYCKVKVKEGRGKQKERTKVISKTRDPVWNETFEFKSCCNRIAVEGDPRMAEPGKAPELNWDLKLKISCYDQDRMGQDENLGVVFVPLAGLPLNKKRDIWVQLSPKIEGQPVSGDLRLRMLLTDR